MRVATFASRFAGGLAARADRLSDRRFAWLCMLPGLLVVSLVVLPPIVGAFGASLWRIEFARDLETPFVGLRNFERMLGDQLFRDAVPRTIVFAIATTVFTLPLDARLGGAEREFRERHRHAQREVVATTTEQFVTRHMNHHKEIARRSAADRLLAVEGRQRHAGNRSAASHRGHG